VTIPVNEVSSNEGEHRRQLATAINELIRGRVNSTGTFTIAAAATTTTVSNALAHAGSVPLLIPTQATTLVPYVTARATGSFTLTHAAAGAATTFLYVLLG